MNIYEQIEFAKKYQMEERLSDSWMAELIGTSRATYRKLVDEETPMYKVKFKLKQRLEAWVKNTGGYYG